MSNPPRLETERLVLRGLRADDFEAFAAMMADPEVARFLTVDQSPQTRESAWRSLAVLLGHWALRGYGMFAVESRETGAFLGRVGPWRPEGWVGFELGWALARTAWGKGFAYEAVRAAGAWALAAHAPDRLVSLIHVDNLRSQNLARRLGMREGEPTLHAGMPHQIWEITASAWEA